MLREAKVCSYRCQKRAPGLRRVFADQYQLLHAALPVLRDGKVLGIFPEGTRSPDGRLYRGRPGVAKLALDAYRQLVASSGAPNLQIVGEACLVLTGFGVAGTVLAWWLLRLE